MGLMWSRANGISSMQDAIIPSIVKYCLAEATWKTLRALSEFSKFKILSVVGKTRPSARLN